MGQRAASAPAPAAAHSSGSSARAAPPARRTGRRARGGAERASQRGLVAAPRPHRQRRSGCRSMTLYQSIILPVPSISPIPTALTAICIAMPLFVLGENEMAERRQHDAETEHLERPPAAQDKQPRRPRPQEPRVRPDPPRDQHRSRGTARGGSATDRSCRPARALSRRASECDPKGRRASSSSRAITATASTPIAAGVSSRLSPRAIARGARSAPRRRRSRTGTARPAG